LTDRRIEDRAKVPSEELDIKGRKLFVPKAARGVAVFSSSACAKTRMALPIT
jgi:cell division protein ZapE